MPLTLLLRQTCLALMLLTAPLAPAGAETLRIAASNGIAIGGRDVVAYFTEGRAMRGKAEFALRWRGVVWMFSSAETMSAFEMNPDAYMPAFGGYCPVALAEGREVAGSPENFIIENGKLYLLAPKTAAATVAREKGERGVVAQADEVWSELSAGFGGEPTYFMADEADMPFSEHMTESEANFADDGETTLGITAAPLK